MSTGERRGLPFVIFNGERRYKAATPPKPGYTCKATPFSAAANKFPVIPRKKWFSVSYAGYEVPIWNQRETNSCTGHGSAGALQKSWLMGGGTPQTFSPGYIYGNNNDGVDDGANVRQVGDSLWTHGACTTDLVPELTIFRSEFPAAADVEARRFRAKVYQASYWDELISGLLYGMIPFYGIHVGDNFAKLDRKGIAPVEKGDPDHCMYADGVTILPSGIAVLRNINSWGEEFGDNGTCGLVEAHVPPGSEICLVQILADDPQETDIPPMVA